MKHSTQELESDLLDLAVGRALGLRCRIEKGTCIRDLDPDPLLGPDFVAFQPSSEWRAAGPIISFHCISLGAPGSPVHRHGGNRPGWGQSDVWTASSYKLRDVKGERRACWGETPLVAAMRLFVLCTLGEEVDL